MDKRKDQPTQVGMSVGFISLLIIFVVLCLITFAILSLTTSNADLALTEKNADYQVSYYEADGECQELLANLDDLLADYTSRATYDEAYIDALGKKLAQPEYADYTFDAGRRVVSFSSEISETSILAAEVTVLPWGESGRYQIVSWAVQPTPLPIEPTEETLWDGGFLP